MESILFLKREVERLKKLVDSLQNTLSSELYDEGDGNIKEFGTVAEMVDSTDVYWDIAECLNDNEGDNNLSTWVRIRGAGLTENGGDLLAASDGSLLKRIYYREYFGSEGISSGTTAAYTIAGLTIFPSLADVRSSYIVTLKIEILPEIDGNGGGDGNGEYAAFVRGGSAVGINGVDYVITAGGTIYSRIP